MSRLQNKPKNNKPQESAPKNAGTQAPAQPQATDEDSKKLAAAINSAWEDGMRTQFIARGIDAKEAAELTAHYAKTRDHRGVKQAAVRKHVLKVVAEKRAAAKS